MAIATQEVRWRAIQAYRFKQGSQEQIAKFFQIGRRTFQVWLKEFKESNKLAPMPHGHNPAAFDGDNLRELDEHVARRPDITLDELHEIFHDRVRCSRITIHNTLRRLGWRYKKSRYERANRIGRT